MSTIFDLVDADDGEAIRELLARESGAVAARDETGVSPLIRAAYRGSRNAFDALLAAGEPRDPWDRLVAGEADGLPAPDAWSPDGFAPLHLAAFAHNVAAARALLAAGADPNVLSRASFAQVTPLGTAAFAGSVEVARVLLEHGADPGQRQGGGGSPLETARARGDAELVTLLEAAG